MVHKNVKHLVSKTKAISDSVLYIVIKPNPQYAIKIIQVYAPTSSHPDEEIEQLYEDISTTKSDGACQFTIVMGDFNAKVGRRTDADLENIGRFRLRIRMRKIRC